MRIHDWLKGNLLRGIVIGRLDSKEVFAEEILPPAIAVTSSASVASIGDNDQIEILVGTDEGIGQSQGRLGRDIAIEFSYNKEESPFQAVGVIDVGGFRVVRSNRIAHPLLIPGGLVHAVVVTATG